MTAAQKAFKKPENKTLEEWLWTLGFRIVGAVMFIVAVWVPAGVLLTEANPDIHIGPTRAWFLGIGFFLVWGSGVFASVANALGSAFSSFVEKFKK